MLQIDSETREKLIAEEKSDREIFRKFREPVFLAEVAENAKLLRRHICNLTIMPESTSRSIKISENFIERRIAHAFRFHGDRVQFDMFAIPKVYEYVREKIMAGENISDAMENAVEKFRLKNKDELH